MKVFASPKLWTGDSERVNMAENVLKEAGMSEGNGSEWNNVTACHIL